MFLKQALQASNGVGLVRLQVVALNTAKPGVTERQDARLALQSTALEARLRLNSPQLKTVSFAHHAPLGPHGDSPETNPAIKTDNDNITARVLGLWRRSRTSRPAYCFSRYLRVGFLRIPPAGD